MLPTATNEELQALIGRALIDPTFAHGLLNGQRDACLAEFPLSKEEVSVARLIDADDLQSYAKQLDTWIQRQQRLPTLRRFELRASVATPAMAA